MTKKLALIWCSFMPLAIVNGIVRERLLLPLIGEQLVLPISGIILMLLIFTLTYFCLPKENYPSSFYFLVGCIWGICTILFEFIFGLSMGNSFSQLLQAYDISTGNLWLVIIFVIGLSHWSVHKLRAKKAT